MRSRFMRSQADHNLFAIQHPLSQLRKLQATSPSSHSFVLLKQPQHLCLLLRGVASYALRTLGVVAVSHRWYSSVARQRQFACVEIGSTSPLTAPRALVVALRRLAIRQCCNSHNYYQRKNIEHSQAQHSDAMVQRQCT